MSLGSISLMSRLNVQRSWSCLAQEQTSWRRSRGMGAHVLFDWIAFELWLSEARISVIRRDFRFGSIVGFVLFDFWLLHINKKKSKKILQISKN